MTAQAMAERPTMPTPTPIPIPAPVDTPLLADADEEVLDSADGDVVVDSALAVAVVPVSVG